MHHDGICHVRCLHYATMTVYLTWACKKQKKSVDSVHNYQNHQSIKIARLTRIIEIGRHDSSLLDIEQKGLDIGVRFYPLLFCRKERGKSVCTPKPCFEILEKALGDWMIWDLINIPCNSRLGYSSDPWDIAAYASDPYRCSALQEYMDGACRNILSGSDLMKEEGVGIKLQMPRMKYIWESEESFYWISVWLLMYNWKVWYK